MSTRAELLNAAVRCFVAGGQDDDACRCLEAVGDYAGAARYHERRGRLEQAANLYSVAQEWASASRCFLKLDRPEPAADALVKAGDPLQAAWVLSDRARQVSRARTVLAGAAVEGAADRVARDLVLARCEAEAEAPGKAAARVASAAASLAGLTPTDDRHRIEEWAVAVAHVLRRYDLIAVVYAASVLAGVPGACRRWEAWAHDTLGDTTGIPTNDDDLRRLTDRGPTRRSREGPTGADAGPPADRPEDD